MRIRRPARSPSASRFPALAAASRLPALLAAIGLASGCNVFQPASPAAPVIDARPVERASSPEAVATLWIAALRDTSLPQLQAILAPDYRLVQAGSGDSRDAELRRHQQLFQGYSIKSPTASLDIDARTGDSATALIRYRIDAVSPDSALRRIGGSARWTLRRDSELHWMLVRWDDAPVSGTDVDWAGFNLL